MAKHRVDKNDFVPIGILLGGEEVEVIDPAEERARLIAEAEAEAAAIRARAEEEAAAALEAAQAQGREEGRRQGEEEGRQQFLAQAAALEKVVAAVAAERREVHRRCLADLRHLVLALLERLLAHEVSVNPRVVTASLRRALAQVERQSRVRVSLHPDDFARVRQAALEDQELLAGVEAVDLVEDPELRPGDCRLETRWGEVDGSLTGYLERLRPVVDQAFLAAVAEEMAAAAPPGPEPATADGPGEEPEGNS